jgi:hypothetical protein
MYYRFDHETLPGIGSTLATVRADLDSIGCMAVLELRRSGCLTQAADGKWLFESDSICGFSECAAAGRAVMDRIALISAADRFDRSLWPGPSPLPTFANPWRDSLASVSDSRPLAAIAACVSDHREPITARVYAMVDWLVTGHAPQKYVTQVTDERLSMLAALDRGDIVIGESDDGVATVVSTHRSGPALGYCRAPVVVAQNPRFSVAGGPEHVKYTISQYSLGYCDIRAVADELRWLETLLHPRYEAFRCIANPLIKESLPKFLHGPRPDDAYHAKVWDAFADLRRETAWGGSATIIGSPQGAMSRVDIAYALDIVKRRLTAA